MKKRVFVNIPAMLLAVVMMLSLAACGGRKNAGGGGGAENAAQEDHGQTEAAFRAAAVLNVGGLGDMSLSDSVYNGLQMAREQLGVEIQWVEPTEIAEFEGHFSELARSGEYDLIIGAGYDMGQAIAKVAEVYKEQKFFLIDGSLPDFSNVASVEYANHERSFIVGCIAGLITRTGVVGAIGGVDASFVHFALSGYEAGARYANPDCKVVFKYTDSWSDTALAKEISIAMFDSGCDVIYNQCGGAGLGIYDAAAERGFYVIGTETNQNDLCPDYMVCSSLSLMAETVLRAIDETVRGQFAAGAERRGFAAGGVGYTCEGSNVELPGETIAFVEAAIEKICSGELVIPASFEEVEPFLAGNR